MNILALVIVNFLPMMDPDGFPMDSGNAAIDPEMMAVFSSAGMIFETNISFSATMSVSISGQSAKGLNIETEARCAFRGRWQRYEFSAAKNKSEEDPQEVALMKKLKMDEAVHVIQPDKNRSFAVYPKLKLWIAYQAMPGMRVKIEKTKIGEESMLGHKCVKYKVVVKDQDGGDFMVHATRWEAVDLNAFPIKSVVDEEGSTLTTIFKDIKLVAPAADLFEPPSGYKQYTNEELLKLMQKGAGKPVEK